MCRAPLLYLEIITDFGVPYIIFFFPNITSFFMSLVFYKTEADMRRESNRKEQEKKKAQNVEFVSGGTQPGIVVGAPRINIPAAGSETTWFTYTVVKLFFFLIFKFLFFFLFFLSIHFLLNVLCFLSRCHIDFLSTGSSAVTASASHLVTSTGDVINREGRQNKKSKWDKVFI